MDKFLDLTGKYPDGPIRDELKQAHLERVKVIGKLDYPVPARIVGVLINDNRVIVTFQRGFSCWFAIGYVPRAALEGMNPLDYSDSADPEFDTWNLPDGRFILPHGTMDPEDRAEHVCGEDPDVACADDPASIGGILVLGSMFTFRTQDSLNEFVSRLKAYWGNLQGQPSLTQ